MSAAVSAADTPAKFEVGQRYPVKPYVTDGCVMAKGGGLNCPAKASRKHRSNSSEDEGKPA
jgi:hypothetical protein